MKVCFIGCGTIGATAAYATALIVNPEEIVLVDIDAARQNAEAEDLRQAVTAFGHETIITGGWENAGESDAYVITAGFRRSPADATRDALIEKNTPVIKEIAGKLKPIAPQHARFVISTNPDTVMKKLFMHETGLSEARVVSIGNLVDTIRLRTVSGNHKSLCLGDHGEEMIPVFEDSPEHIHKTKNSALEIIKGKGFTQWLPSTAIALLLKGIKSAKHAKA